MAVTQVASAASDTRLIQSRDRAGLLITNTDANRLYVMADSQTVTAALYSFYLEQGETFDLQSYEGEVRGIWAADGAGHALVTEY